MAPAGGYKGVGTALLVEIFAACLTGAIQGCRQPFSGTAGGATRNRPVLLAVSPEATSGGAFAGNLETVAGAFIGEARLPGTRRSARAGMPIEVRPNAVRNTCPTSRQMGSARGLIAGVLVRQGWMEVRDAGKIYSLSRIAIRSFHALDDESARTA
ncbi:hypothetical protein [Mesorhizobium sp. M2A.F.Ca.ET.043.02.1.1]|uniref:hypothetical protein n=1 Tax=Mesorhizobium sp. M2A.F.Ca.ET.043.02.1.1 TaxID=2493670 RepID=UPI001AECD070|nr:hypothetical protein [Mesorhizobium sp. M2A.F.Ca.ET.043.02.1.1]